MKETMTTYDFWTLAGQHLGTITTDDPHQTASELSHFTGIDADEIEWETPQEMENEPC